MAGARGRNAEQWLCAAREVEHLLRPDTRAKYLGRNPVRKALVLRFLGELARELETFSWTSLLEVGCGEGLVLRYLSLRFPGREMTGLDPDPESFPPAFRLNPAAAFIKGEGGELPFPGRSFDIVILIEVLEHTRDFFRLLEEAARVAREGIVVSVPAFPFYQVMNFLAGKNLARLGEHPGHVVRFTGRRLERALLESGGRKVSLRFAIPWLIGSARMEAKAR